MHDMPTFKQLVKLLFLLDENITLISLKGIHDTLNFPCFLPGADAEQLYHNFFDWLYQVYEETGLSCTSTN